MYAHGLVLGKLYPPHRGHAHLIEEAAARCSRVTVVILGSQVQRISPEQRADWVRTWIEESGLSRRTGAEITVISALDDAPVDYDSDTAWTAHTEIIRRLLTLHGLPPLDAVISSEEYGTRLAEELGASAVVLDPARAAEPVSATGIRADLTAGWEDILPAARRGLSTRIVIVGAESTGTTTLSRALAEHYRSRWPSLEFVPEWGREYTYIKHAELVKTQPGATVEDLVWTPEDFVSIAREQNRIEDAAAEALPLVIADTDAWATVLWERFYLGDGEPASAAEGAAVGPRAVYLVTDHVGVPFEADGWREGEHRRAEMTEWFLEGLAASGHSWVLLRGSKQERLDYAIRIIDPLLDSVLDVGKWTV